MLDGARRLTGAGLVVAAALFAAPLAGQDGAGYTNVISANPFGLLLDLFNAEYERVFTESTTIGVGGSYGEGALIVDDKTAGYYSTAAASIGLQLGGLLGEVGRGHKVALNTLNYGRFKLAACAHGGAKAVIGEAAAYVVPPMVSRLRLRDVPRERHVALQRHRLLVQRHRSKRIPVQMVQPLRLGVLSESQQRRGQIVVHLR